MVAPGYLRFPHVCGELVTFVAADDVWLAPVGGGRAWRFTADAASSATPRFSSDGACLAWTSSKDGGSEIYQASVADGVSTPLSYWGAAWARVCGWTPRGEAIAVSPAGQPFGHYVWARAVPRLAFWLDGFGWGVENYGVEPDLELIPTPDDWAAGRDVQLEAAVRLALEALRDSPAVSPPDRSNRPSRRRPALSPRSA